jgi:hypothetical protein
VSEIDVVLNKHRDKLHVFIAPRDASDRHLRNIVAIALVRAAQGGNLSNKEKVVDLLRNSLDKWLDRHHLLVVLKGSRPPNSSAIGRLYPAVSIQWFVSSLAMASHSAH